MIYSSYCEDSVVEIQPEIDALSVFDNFSFSAVSFTIVSHKALAVCISTSLLLPSFIEWNKIGGQLWDKKEGYKVSLVPERPNQT